MARRMIVGLISGAGLGLICVLGASIRLGWGGNQLLMISLWYNRLLMGLVIGLAGDVIIIQDRTNWAFRGILLGLLISAAYFLTAGAGDWVSFLIGGVYGFLIELILRQQQA